MDEEKGFEHNRAMGLVIAARIARLSPACRRMLAFASVLGRELEGEALERLVGAEPAALGGLIAEARSAGIIAEIPGEGRRLRFAHALLRDACYATLSPSLRARLHRRASEVLASAAPETAQIAHHLAAGARDEDRWAAAEGLLKAAEAALRSLAFEEAARLCARGLEVLGNPPAEGPAGEPLRARLRLVLRDALRGSADPLPETPSPP